MVKTKRQYCPSCGRKLIKGKNTDRCPKCGWKPGGRIFGGERIW